MNLPKLQESSLSGKKIILRADLDVDLDQDGEEYRLKALVPTIKYLSENRARTIIIGHKGRPEGKVDESLSLKAVIEKLSALSGLEITFYNGPVSSLKQETEKLAEGSFLCLENLRFDSREEENDPTFAKELSLAANFYVNESFATHSSHTSIVRLPKLLPHAAGIRFCEEVDQLEKVRNTPTKPFIFIIGGIKKEKTEYIKPISQIADKVLVGGRLPEYLGDNTVSVRSLDENEKTVIANLIMDKEDITIHSIERFEAEIAKAKTIVLAGPMGKYEEEGHRQGTQRIFTAVANSDSYKIVGGGDSHIVISDLKIADKFNWVSVGGGAMLEYLAKGTLPSIEALLE